MKILITGASGFVGQALWRVLVAEGHDVLATGRRQLGLPGYISRDLANPLALDFRPEVVVHAAARSSPWGTDRDYQRQNVDATRHVLDFCEKSGRPHLVHISTSAVMYTNAHQCGLTEESPLPPRPINRYAATKLEAEKLVHGYAGDFCIVRPRAVYGPGDTVVFPRIVQAARLGRMPRLVSDQPVLGDLIYIETLVDYLRRIIAKRARGTYLLTNNQPVAIWAFLDDVFTRLGLPIPQRTVPVGRAMLGAHVIESAYRLLPFMGEPPITTFGVSVFAYSKTFDVSRALRDFGPPAVSLEEGVARFVEWWRRQYP